MTRFVASPAPPAGGGPAEPDLLVRARCSPARDIRWLAHRVGASERTLTRLHRAEFGTTYPQWRNTVRIVQAMIELAEGAGVTETAHRCGCATPSAFIDTFARAMGQAPGAYRSAVNPAAERG